MVPGNTYQLSVQYESTAVTQFALYYRTTFGNWAYWTSGPWFAASPTWATATFTTPAVPAGANGVSFGLALIANGPVTTDDYSFVLPAAGGSGLGSDMSGRLNGAALASDLAAPPVTPISREKLLALAHQAAHPRWGGMSPATPSRCRSGPDHTPSRPPNHKEADGSAGHAATAWPAEASGGSPQLLDPIAPLVTRKA